MAGVNLIRNKPHENSHYQGLFTQNTVLTIKRYPALLCGFLPVDAIWKYLPTRKPQLFFSGLYLEYILMKTSLTQQLLAQFRHRCQKQLCFLFFFANSRTAKIESPSKWSLPAFTLSACDTLQSPYKDKVSPGGGIRLILNCTRFQQVSFIALTGSFVPLSTGMVTS